MTHPGGVSHTFRTVACLLGIIAAVCAPHDEFSSGQAFNRRERLQGPTQSVNDCVVVRGVNTRDFTCVYTIVRALWAMQAQAGAGFGGSEVLHSAVCEQVKSSAGTHAVLPHGGLAFVYICSVPP